MSKQLSKSTPGPWAIGVDGGFSGPWAIGSAGGYTYRLEIEPAIGCVYGTGEEILANARLVIAAPTLLAIVQTIATLLDKGVPSAMILDENSPTVDAIRDVLAKVSGGAAA